MSEKIKTVETLDERAECISVELTNGSVIVLELARKRDDPLFAEIGDLSRPRTDGKRVYWVNGASLTLDDIMELLESDAEP